ncbi:hypothetical protein [Streptomyces sp. NPDC057301]|uniref:hypothetical protein n=1 Tax=Streptomyces sp. NPDC057301 TaxID=3346093 RepID=UPI0036252B61
MGELTPHFSEGEAATVGDRVRYAVDQLPFDTSTACLGVGHEAISYLQEALDQVTYWVESSQRPEVLAQLHDGVWYAYCERGVEYYFWGDQAYTEDGLREVLAQCGDGGGTGRSL